MKKASLLIALGLTSLAVRAQLQINGPMYISAGAVLAVNGGNVAATTDILGPGTLELEGTSAQNLDMGGFAVNSLMVDNVSGVALTGDATIGSLLLFNNGNVSLGNNNLVFASAASHIGAASGKNVVTNGTGFVTKQGLAQNASFTFPVSQAAGEYTPAVVNNQDPAARDFNVRVMSYATSGALEGNVTKGIDRTWQVTSSAAGLANVGLTHNNVTNAQGAGTSGAAFATANAFVTQQTASGSWSVGTQQPSGGATVNTIGATYTVPASAAAATSYFSKSSDTISSLSVRILVNPVALLQGAWNSGTSAMNTSLNTLNLIPTTQPYNSSPFNYSGTEKVGAIPAGVTDWILVDLRSEITSSNTSSSIVATRAALLKSNGQIVDVDGTSPVSFVNVPAGNYIVGIRHRNHLGVQSNLALPMALETTVNQDFTSAANVYRNVVAADNNEPQALLAGGSGKYGLWAGNTNGNGTIRVNGAATVNDNLWIINNVLSSNPSNVVGPVYSRGDVNMNGVVRVTGSATVNDNLFIVNNALGTDPTTTLVQHQQ